MLPVGSLKNVKMISQRKMKVTCKNENPNGILTRKVQSTILIHLSLETLSQSVITTQGIMSPIYLPPGTTEGHVTGLICYNSHDIGPLFSQNLVLVF